MSIRNIILSTVIFIPFLVCSQNQSFYYGNDLSYVNQMEDCGAVYKENGEAKDPFLIFADHGTNLIRVRLWKDPSWWQGPLDQPEGVKSYYNDLDDVKKTIRRAKENGMEVMLGIHYSDFWADPGHQLIPRDWLDVAYDLEALKDSVYNYTVRVLTELDREGLMPNIVKVGNENNGGILTQIPEDNGWEVKETVSNDWGRHAQLFNTAIQAVRQVGSTAAINPKIALHMTNGLDGLYWNYQNRFIANGVTDFDIVGFSYYFAWHGGSIAQLESTVGDLTEAFDGYEVMAVETGYPWTNQNFDQLGNIVTDMDPDYNPLSPERQLEYMIDYTRAVMKGGGTGVIFWEPAWVTTPCRTPWGIGSSHDHLAFFDPVNTDFIVNGGGRWTEPQWYDDNQVKVGFKVDMFEEDVTNGVYLMGDFVHEPIEMIQIDEDIYYQYRFLDKGTDGNYYFLNGPDLEHRETVPEDCSGENSIDRPYHIEVSDTVLDHRWSSCELSDPDRHLFHEVTFRVNLEGHDLGDGAFITGSFTGDPWQILPMNKETDLIYSYSITLREGRSGAFYFLNQNDWSARETVPESCAPWWGVDRGYEVRNDEVTYSYAFGSCDEQVVLSLSDVDQRLVVYPNPTDHLLHVESCEPINSLRLVDLSGNQIKTVKTDGASMTVDFPVMEIEAGLYILEVVTDSQKLSSGVVISK